MICQPVDFSAGGGGLESHSRTGLDALGKLYCMDGSVFPALVTMLWAEYTSQHRAIRLHLCFELNRMLVVQFLVDTGKSNEKKAVSPFGR